MDVVDRGVGRRGGAGGTARVDDLGAAFRHPRDVLVGDEGLVVDLIPGARRRRPWRSPGRGTGSVEWLPQTVMLVTEVTGLPSLLASWVLARLWSRRIIAVKRSRGTSGAFDIAIRQLVLAGLPTTSTLMSSAAPALIASPCGLKMPPLASSRSARSMPGPRGRAPTSRAMLVPSKAFFGSSVMSTRLQQREGAVVELHRGALGGLHRLRDLQQAQLDRGVGAEHLTAGDAEQQGVADLSGGARNGDLHGGAHRLSPRNRITATARQPSPAGGCRRSTPGTPAWSGTPGRRRRAAPGLWSSFLLRPSRCRRARGSGRTR